MICELCKLERRTHRYFEDKLIVVLDCATHGTPMWILRRHTSHPMEWELWHGRAVCRRLFGENISFRGPQTIKDHYHEHVEGVK